MSTAGRTSRERKLENIKFQGITTTNETDDNLTPEAQINPSDYQFDNENLAKKEVLKKRSLMKRLSKKNLCKIILC